MGWYILNGFIAVFSRKNGNIEIGFDAIENSGIIFSELNAKIIGTGKNGYLFLSLALADQTLTPWETCRVAHTNISLRDTVYANIINDYGTIMLFTLTSDGYLDINPLSTNHVDLSTFRGCIPLCFA